MSTGHLFSSEQLRETLEAIFPMLPGAFTLHCWSHGVLVLTLFTGAISCYSIISKFSLYIMQRFWITLNKSIDTYVNAELTCIQMSFLGSFSVSRFSFYHIIVGLLYATEPGILGYISGILILLSYIICTALAADCTFGYILTCIPFPCSYYTWNSIIKVIWSFFS